MLAALAIVEGLTLAMEVVPVLDVVYLGNELLLDRLARMKVVKRLAHHHLKVVVRLLNLADVDRLELYCSKMQNR